MLLAFGLAPLINCFANPRLQAIHGADRVQLMAAGACLGVAMVGLLGRLRVHDE